MKTAFALDVQDFDPEMGQVAETTDEARNFNDQGWQKCANPGCWFYVSPEGKAYMGKYEGSNFTCPNCGQQQELYDDLGQAQRSARAGMSLGDMGRIGETAAFQVAQTQQWKEKYGEIIWWQPGATSFGGAPDVGKFDGYSKKGQDVYAIEVKAANVDNTSPSFLIPADERRQKHDYAANFAQRNPELAQTFGVVGRSPVEIPEDPKDTSQDAQIYTAGNNDIDALLAVLPIFDFKNSEVDVYVRETPLSGHPGLGNMANKTFHGFVRRWTPRPEFLLVGKVPFRNPFMDHDSNIPALYDDYSQLISNPEQMFTFEPPTTDDLLFRDVPPSNDPSNDPNRDPNRLPF